MLIIENKKDFEMYVSMVLDYIETGTVYNVTLADLSQAVKQIDMEQKKQLEVSIRQNHSVGKFGSALGDLEAATIYGALVGISAGYIAYLLTDNVENAAHTGSLASVVTFFGSKQTLNAKTSNRYANRVQRATDFIDIIQAEIRNSYPLLSSFSPRN